MTAKVIPLKRYQTTCVCGWKLPKDVLLTTFDDITKDPLLSYECPECGTTVRHKIRKP
jgi:hypothetical protein